MVFKHCVCKSRVHGTLYFNTFYRQPGKVKNLEKVQHSALNKNMTCF